MNIRYTSAFFSMISENELFFQNSYKNLADFFFFFYLKILELHFVDNIYNFLILYIIFIKLFNCAMKVN